MKITARSSTNVQVEIKAGRHEFVVDEPLDIGDDAGPDPYSLLLGSLGTCGAFIFEAVATENGFPLDALTVNVEADFDLRNAPRCGRNSFQAKDAQYAVVGRHRALALQDLNVNGRLSVFRCTEYLRFARRDRCIARDQRRHDATQRFQAQA